MLDLLPSRTSAFDEDGFVILEGVIGNDAVEGLRKNFGRLFRGEFETGVPPEIMLVVVRQGGGSIHHGWTWHGSGDNNGPRPRRSLVLHAISTEARYMPENLSRGTGPVYARYKRLGDNAMDENYFPILWTRDGRRTVALDDYLAESC